MAKMLGKFKAVVVSNADPEKRGRIQTYLMGEEEMGNLDWAEPCISSNIFFFPKEDDVVWLEFEDGDIDQPIWVGTFPTPDKFEEVYAGTYDPSKQIILKADGTKQEF
jgi:Type VI secretion system/phage-baseplate injector OB domain